MEKNQNLKWQTPATLYPEEARCGKAFMWHRKYPAGKAYWAEGMRGQLVYRFARGHSTVTELMIDGQTWMTDLPPYFWSMEHFAVNSKGRVLVAGLGLGLIVHCLCRNPAVDEITVIDREQDVIGLIAPLLPKDERIKIVNDDFYEFMNADDQHRDTVIWDLGLWDEKGCVSGRPEIFLIKAQALDKYGDKTIVFRHGADRDPVGAEFVKSRLFRETRRALDKRR